MNYQRIKEKFLFYDYETFGLHPALDKPAQFACIKTDQNFNIINKPRVLYCYPPKDYLPNIQSILITGITPQYVFQHGINEFFFSKKIFKIFNTNNTCIIGYNNIIFDDEVTRNIFYRNLLDPYSWSWKNNNSRWDVISFLRVCYVLSPSGIIWPKNTNGKISFKLKDLTKVNNIFHNKIHDALSDVYASLFLMKFLKEKKKELFDFFFKYRLKKNIKKIINIQKKIPIIYIANIFGEKRNYLSCILPIFWNFNNSNMLIFFDLYYNLENICLYLKNTKINNFTLYNLYHLGISYLYVNKCPTLIPMDLFNSNILFKLGIDINKYLQKIYFFSKNFFLFKKIDIFFKNFQYNIYNQNVDLKIYENFFSEKDKKTMNIIHNISINKLNNKKFYFYDTRLKEVFFRLLARNFPNLLNFEKKDKWLLYRLNIFNKHNIYDYLINLTHLFYKYHNNAKKINLLKDIKKYINIFFM